MLNVGCDSYLDSEYDFDGQGGGKGKVTIIHTVSTTSALSITEQEM